MDACTAVTCIGAIHSNEFRGGAAAQVRELPKSMLAAKSFEEVRAPAQLPALERWMGILAEELADRLAEDCALHCRRPRALTLYYRRGISLPVC